MNEKRKEEFVVEDRRRFNAEGEKSESSTKVEDQPQMAAANTEAPALETPEVPPPPTAQEQHAQKGEYHSASKKLDDMLDAAGTKRPANLEINFEGLISSLYLQTMMQLGMVREENTPPRPDIIGARQTIDTIAMLGEKTKGNLTDRESHLLQNVLFELRMAFLEITNAITSAPSPGTPKK